MIFKTDTTNDSRLRYGRPEVKAIEVKARHVLCLSNGNESMREVDYGDGGFSEE